MSAPDRVIVDPAADGWVLASAGPFMTWLGPVWRRAAGAGFEYGLVGQQMHSNHRDIVHGGVIMAFADHALGRIAADLNPGDSFETAQIDVQFVAAAEIGSLLVGRAEIVRRTSSLFFLRGTLETAGKVVASAQGVWKTVKPARPAGN